MQLTEIKITSFTDESGSAPSGRKFIVVTSIVENENYEIFTKILEKVELKSSKTDKWSRTKQKKRDCYLELLLKESIFKYCKVYYSINFSKGDYVTLFTANIAKSVLSYSGDKPHRVTIFVDKVSNSITNKILLELKKYNIKYKKVRALDDTNSVGLKFVDTICGMVRDISHRDDAECFKRIMKLIVNI